MQSVSTRCLRVLVAEDEPLAALVIEEVLAAEGHAVCLAADGQAALDLAQRQDFDLLITDLNMPRMTGLELLRQLRHCRPDLPTVVMTGFLSAAAAGALRAEVRPPVALLQKPFDLDQLVAVVSQAGLPQSVRAVG